MMTLHEAIENILRQSKRPLSARDIASIINSQDYYKRKDNSPIEAKQVLSRVKNYPSLFEVFNGHIILIEDEIWKNLFKSVIYLNSLLRGRYSSEDVQFILAVLIYYKRLCDKDGTYHLPKLSLSLDIYNNVDNAFKLIDDLQNYDKFENSLSGIFRECANLLSRLDGYKKAEIFGIIIRFDTTELDDKTFGDMFEYFLGMFPNDKYNPTLSPTPYSLRELMIRILNPNSGSSLYDPVAGVGGLLIEAFYYTKNSVILTGNEINLRTTQLGNINLAIHGIEGTQITLRDSFEDVNNGIFYDNIVADLPISGNTISYGHEQLFNSYNLNIPSSRQNFSSLILLIISKLAKSGKAVITVSEGFLVKKGRDLEVRNLLIRLDVIESVISLPYGTLRPYTEAKASLLVINKDKNPSLKNKIRFITAREVNHDSREVYLNNDEILEAYTSDNVLSKDFQIIDTLELRPDFNLSADSYDEQYFLANIMLKEGSGKLLSELVKIKGGLQPEKIDINRFGDYPLIKIENLSHDILDAELTGDITNKVHASPRYTGSLINERCLLIARIGEKTKATIFSPNENRPNILIHSGVYALIPSANVNLEYLYYQFYSSFVLQQIKNRKSGAVMPYISIGNLKDIVIPYVDLSSQRSFIESQKANLISEEKNRANAVIKALGSREVIRQSETEIVKTLTHQLRPKLMEIHSLAQRIGRVIEKEGLDDLMEYNDDIEEVDPELAGQIMQSDNYPLKKLVGKVLNDSEHLSNVLSVVDKVMNFKLSADNLVPTDLLKFLLDYKKSKDIIVNQRYEIQIKGENAIVEINHAAFVDLLDQLAQNAEDHGFIENIKNKKYRLNFNVKVYKHRDVVSIDYSNNGATFELQHKDFITAFDKGRNSKGSGIGGNYINRIVEAHGGKLTINENVKGFSLSIELPINKNITDE